MKRLGACLVGMILLSVALPCFGQYYTFSLTRGWNFSPNSWEKYIECPTTGADFSVSWDAVHPENGRRPYRLGLKANFAWIPQGIAGHRGGVSGFATTPLASIRPSAFGLDLPGGNLSAEIGAGFGFYTKPWEQTHDDKNTFIATYLNCVMDFGLVYTQPIGGAGALVVGAKFVHNSNGFLAKPNQGLNYLQGELGWQIPARAQKQGLSEPIRYGERFDARTGGFLVIAPGMTIPRNENAKNGDFFPAYTVQFGWRYAYMKCRSIALSVDFAYNFADNYEYILAGEPTPFPMFVALAATHETHWGPLSLRMGVGYHIIESFPDSRLYERVGVFYHFPGKVHQFAGISIKANSTHADFIEWSYGIDLW